MRTLRPGSWGLLAVALLFATLVGAWSDPDKDESRKKGRDKDRGRAIVPVMGVCPQVFPLESTCCVVLSVTNGNTEEPGDLSPGDTFYFQFPSQGMTLSGPMQVQVNAAPAPPSAWQAGADRSGLCYLRYVGPRTRLTARDLITCKLNVSTGGQPIQGQVQFQGPQRESYDAPLQLCAPLCLMESPIPNPGGQFPTVLGSR